MPLFMARDVRGALGTDGSRCANRSLLASKFPDIATDDKDKEARRRSIERMLGVSADQAGWHIRSQFLESLDALGGLCTRFVATLRGRLVVNQAGGVVENAGLCLDPHFGLPFIPGSALKGIARAAARTCGGDAGETLAVFGWSAGDRSLPGALQENSFAGAVAFLPAYPLADAPLTLDIVTCHHSEYYRDADVGRALDTEAPIPNIFPVVEAGTSFNFAMVLTLPKLRLERISGFLKLASGFDPLQQARACLINGLTDHGVGAKTAAGYGWFDFDADSELRQREMEESRRKAHELELKRQAEEEQERAAEQARLAAMSPVERAKEQLLTMSDEEFAAFGKSLVEKSPDEQRAFLRTLCHEKKDRWKVWKKRKPQLADLIQGLAGKLGEELP